MLYQFDTNDLDHAKAALLLYAMYRSRGTNSSLTGVDTWDRVASYIRASAIKSNTTGEFVQNFCKKAKISSIQPRFLKTGDPMQIPGTLELVISDDYKNYSLDILEDDNIYRLMDKESMYIIMLVRERIQREKFVGESEDAE